MGKISFNEGWMCGVTGTGEARPVTVPHDAMQWDEKKADVPGGKSLGWIDARDYTYTKEFELAKEDRDFDLILEFEGVYRRAKVTLNGKVIAEHEYGYTGFYANLGSAAVYGGMNRLEVSCVNSDQPNSRWYSGTGIYRPVWLYKLPKAHIVPDSLRVKTIDVVNPLVAIELETTTAGLVQLELFGWNGKKIAETSGMTIHANGGKYRFRTQVELPGAALWSPEFPMLHTCRAVFGDDSCEVEFGVREVTCDSAEGFCINGDRVILRGCCIHHDNGFLGARAYDFAEERKVRLLKENGYNAIRSSHNPCSKAFLRACDRLGMLVLDEYVDGWYIHKSRFDYGSFVEENYRKDLADLVAKDFNHPSVVMYSIGNEVSETAQERGIELTRAMVKRLHDLDGTRPVTCGVNIFFNFLSSMGFGVYSDKKAEEAAENPSTKKAVGSEFFNNLAGLLGAGFMKFGATLYPCDVKTRGAYSVMDIAGYNYGINRYRHDLKKYPGRVILGSETFCSDAAAFMDLAQKEKRLIGDFVWAGMDYLGEVGIGAREYPEYAGNLDGGLGWVAAGSGRLDLTGKPLAEMVYTRVAYGLDPVGIGVIPLGHRRDKYSPSSWKMTNAMESWSWDGCEGEKARVEVYSRADHVILSLNGKEIGTKKPEANGVAVFRVPYEPGELTVTAHDEFGRRLGQKTLCSASAQTILRAEPEQLKVSASSGLCYVRFRYTDPDGILKPQKRADIKLTVENGEILGFGSACPYYTKDYLGNVADTYYGEALAIIRPLAAGTVKVRAQSLLGNAEASIEAV